MAEREKTRNENVEAQEKMKHDLIKDIESLDAAFEVYFTRYMAETQQKTEQYSNLLKTNTETSEEINRLTRQINRLNELTALWRLKTQQNYRECKDRDDQLRKEKVIIVRHYHDLKRKMANQRNEKDS